jgi:hypothetical protein
MGVGRTTKFIDAMFPIGKSYGDGRAAPVRGGAPARAPK